MTMAWKSKLNGLLVSVKHIPKLRQWTKLRRHIGSSSIAEKNHFPVWATEATLYVHWPFCEKRCTYCNFNKYINPSVDHKRMTDCLITEIKTLLELSYVTEVKSIFFGGGTPSLAHPQTIASVIQAVQDNTHLAETAEITIEVNPTSAEAGKLRDFRAAGVNRISLGLQALSDKDLLLLGRQHTVQDGLKCLEEAKRIFPGCTSVDLMFGRPYQTVGCWHKELNEVLGVCDDHLSLYQLTLERGTALFKQVTNGLLSLPEMDALADMYEVAVEALAEAGLHRYEVSNFAKQGAESSHNKAYWSGGQYIGVGPGAHGRFVSRKDPEFQRTARIQTLEPTPWMIEVEQHGHATRRIVKQNKMELLEEVLLLGLRTSRGVPEELWQRMGGQHPLVDIFGDDPFVQMLIDGGHLMLDQNGLVATHSGISVIDNITAHLIHKFHQHFLKKLSESICL